MIAELLKQLEAAKKEYEPVKKQAKVLKDKVDKIEEEIEKLTCEAFKQHPEVTSMVVEGNVLLTRILKPKKVISLLEVIKNQEALSRLTGALEGETCKGSITLAFDDCLLGMPEYTSFIDTTPEEKYKAVFMNESEK